MNIKISKKECDFIRLHYKEFNPQTYSIGSNLYGTIDLTKGSDIDFLVIYKSIFRSDIIYPNYHQFQYDDKINNIQYILTSEQQFWKNLLSGDSTINADVVMFTNYKNFALEQKLNICRTYNVIKAFIGFAKRDIKDYKQGKGKNKAFHISRGLYCAECLLNNALPSLNEIQKFKDNNGIGMAEDAERILRKDCNEMFEKNELTMYPKDFIIQPVNSLEQKLIESNNIKEFRYE